VGRRPQEIANNIGLTPVSKQDVWLVGARDIDPLEKLSLETSLVNRITLDELALLSIKRPIHLHLDNDVMDAIEVPANNYPVADGPSSAELIAACTLFISDNNVVAISFSGWNSKLGEAHRTGKVCANVLNAFVAAATAGD
jgi:arginase